MLISENIWGATGAINKKIMETLKNPGERVNFFIL